MPPIHRYHAGTIVAPVTLLDAIDSAFGVTTGGAEDFALKPEEATALETVCTFPPIGRDTITLDATAFTRARNILDLWTLGSCCESTDDGPDTPIGLTCDFCLWCQCLVLRDWCDEILDRAGFEPPPYLDPTPPESDIGTLYADIWADVNHRYHASPSTP